MRPFVLLCLMLLLVAGCKKNPQPAVSAESGSAAAPAASAADPGTPGSVPLRPEQTPLPGAPPIQPIAITNADTAGMLTTLTHIARRYSMEKRQVPKSVNDLVIAGYLTSLPQPPAGKKFVIDSKTVQVQLK